MHNNLLYTYCIYIHAFTLTYLYMYNHVAIYTVADIYSVYICHCDYIIVKHNYTLLILYMEIVIY